MKKDVSLLFILDGQVPYPFTTNNGGESSKPFLERILYVIDRATPKLIPINLRMLNRQIKCITQEIKTYSANSCTEALEILNNDLGANVVSAIIKGNCEILGIMSSPGGHGGTSKDIKYTFDFLNKNGAVSKLFVFDQAASAAFILASAFQEKYCLEETEFMFHRGEIPKELELDQIDENSNSEESDKTEMKEMAEQIDIQEMTEHLDAFFANCDPDYIVECEEMKKVCLENLDADIYYSGEHLHRMGVIKECIDSPENLTKLFEETIGVPLKPESTIYKLLRKLESDCHETIENGIFSFALGLFHKNESPHILKHNTAKIDLKNGRNTLRDDLIAS